MPRKLKTYTTTIGFYDLAVAAPSMKAALEAWGAKQNLFHQGLAEESNDPAIVMATLEKPGTVLRRAVGTNAPFQEHGALPKGLLAGAPRRKPKPREKPAKNLKVSRPPEVKKAAVIQFAKEKAKRDRQRQKEEADRRRDAAVEARAEEHRQRAAQKALAVLDRARARHEEKLEQLDQERQAVEERIEAERARWEKQESELERNLQKARR